MSARGSRRILFVVGLGLLAGVAGIALVATLGSGPNGAVSGFEPSERELLFPDLANRAGEVAGIEIDDGPRQTALTRQDGSWRLASLSGYPARSARVETLLDTVATLRPVLVSETDAPRYADFGLAPPGSGLGSGVAVKFADASGAAVNELLIGHTAPAAGAVGSAGNTHVRTGADPQVWIVEGDLAVAANPREWVDTRIVDVARTDVVHLENETVEGARLVVTRGEDGDLALREGPVAPDDLAGVWVLDRLASVLEAVEFEDVRAVPTDEEPAEDGRALRVHSAEGIAYAVEYRVEDEGRNAVARFSAGLVEGADAASGARERVADFNARHDGWEYGLSTYTTDLILVSAENLQ